MIIVKLLDARRRNKDKTSRFLVSPVNKIVVVRFGRRYYVSGLVVVQNLSILGRRFVSGCVTE